LVATVVVLAGAIVASATTPTVLVATNATFGPVLTNASGLALYTLDTDHNGQSTCHGACAAAWPPITVPAGTVPTGGAGVTGSVGAAKQSNGTFQVTYNGSPLYTFVGDSAPGQVTGNGVSGFSVVVVTAAVTTTTTSTPGTTPPPTGGAGSAAPATAASGSAPAPSGTTAAGTGTGTPGRLAFTGAGPILVGLSALGLLLVMLGALLAFGSGRDPREADPE